MASTTKKTRLIHDLSSEYYLHPSEGPGNTLTKHVLKGENIDTWEKTIVNALKGRSKAGFLSPTGMPKPTDPAELEAWEANNSTICSWIFNSVDEIIQPSIASHTVVHELWLDLKTRYSTINEPRIYQLENELQNLRQKGQTVVVYYNQFVTLWNKLYGIEDPTCGCACLAAAKLRANAEKAKTRKFLLGLDDEQFGTLRGQILGTQPLADLNKAFYLISQEERHRSVVRARDDHTDAMAFAAPRTGSNPYQCTNCGKQGHTADRCYLIIGFPSSVRGRGRTSSTRGGGRSNRGGRASAQSPLSTAGQSGNPAPLAGTSTANAVTDVHNSLSSMSPDQVARLFSMLDSTPSSSDKLQELPGDSFDGKVFPFF
ncbi:unnamed protein product [Cuscuta campestris]|uniref:CCHC-type domain-containing protein n=1 Tax=Cuscuta campestris TaxID=132261 RepID=A0A484MQU1_9ASTE|nr:unnamed protein product [Cuscuta campestris]